MKFNLSIYVFVCFLMFSCDKEEQSCSDGKFTPEKEEKVDCGGVCPPCDFEPTVIDHYVSAKVNGESVSFTDFGIAKNANYILTFFNDSLTFNLNLGADESLGSHQVLEVNSNGTKNGEQFLELYEGVVVFSEVDTVNKEMSGFFKAKFHKTSNYSDTLALTSGAFSKVSW